MHNAIVLIHKQSLYLTKWKRSKVIIKHRKKTIFPYKHKLNVQNHSKTKLYRPTAAGGGSSDTNEGIVVNPMKGGKAAVGSRSDLDSLLKGCLQNKKSKYCDIKDIPKAMSTTISMEMIETVILSLFLTYTY